MFVHSITMTPALPALPLLAAGAGAATASRLIKAEPGIQTREITGHTWPDDEITRTKKLVTRGRS